MATTSALRPDSPVGGVATPDGVRLVRSPAVAESDVILDPSQQQVVDRRAGSGPVVVVGGPGTGKTTTLIQAVTARVMRDGVPPESLLVLAPTRVAAATLRDRLTGRITGAGRSALREPPVRTAASYAFSLIRREAVRRELPVPRLISGPEQDAILADLLTGHAAGEGLAPGWPDAVSPALALRGFRHELRDLLMRAMERGIDPTGLARLARRYRRPEWQAAASVYQEYLDVTSLATPGAFDPAALVDEAAAMLASDAELLAHERRRLRLIAVDDHHESSEAVARLLDQLVPRGADLIVTGDPDATTLSFRGAQSRLIGEASHRHPCREGDAPVFVLGSSWRHGPTLVAALGRVSARIGAQPPLAAQRRAAQPAGPQGSLHTALLRSGGAQVAYIAQQLRRAHLLHGVPWSRQVVITRTGGQAAALRRGLAQAGVPIGHSTAEVALRDEPAVRALLLAAQASLNSDLLFDDDRLVSLLTTLGHADHLRLRSLRAALVRAERAVGGSRTSTELLGAAVGCDPDQVVELLPSDLAEPLAAPVLRVAGVLSAGRAALAAPSSTAESVLWSLWQATGHADLWREHALTGGRRGRRADRDLDTVVALFEAANRFADRMPGAGVAEFIERLREQELPEDTLAARAALGESVVVTTAQSVIGREFDLVVIAGLQDGTWPNTRLRGSLLGSTDLVDLHSGREVDRPRGRGQARDAAAMRAARTEVLHDELRMLYVAVSRARQRVLVTAVSNADDVPSPFIDLIDPLEGDQARPITKPGAPVSLSGVVMQLRAQLGSADDEQRHQAAAQLNRLAREGVRGAAPADWYGLAGLSVSAPLAAGRPVSVSPSALEEFGTCPLRWLFGRSGGRPPAPPTTGVGSLVHDLAHELPTAPLPDLQNELARRWPQLGVREGWVSDQLQARAEKMLQHLVEYRRHQGEVVGRELGFAVEVAGARITGRVDQLERSASGDLVAIDFKTTRTPPAAAQVAENPQLGAYQLAVERGAFDDVAPGASSGGARLVQLGTKNKSVKIQDQAALSASDDPGWAEQLVAEAARGMGGVQFVAVINDGCRHCSLRASCPAQAEGQQVGR